MPTLSELPFVTPEDITERAMEAIHGGRQITAYLNYLDEHNRARVSGKYGQEEVNRVWHGALDPAIGWDNWARAGGESYRPGMDFRRNIGMTLADAEAMLDWPIYRAAILTEALAPILFADGPGTQWNADTLDAIGQLGVRAGSIPCVLCSHRHHDEDCDECDWQAQLGQPGPCQTIA